jgi:hypothetical protein
LEEFINIINSAAASVSEVKDDMEKVVPSAERALDQILDTIVKCSFARSDSDIETQQQQLMVEAAEAATSATAETSTMATLPRLSNPSSAATTTTATVQKTANLSAHEEATAQELTAA